jgi:flagellar hook protein FlgE
MTLLTSLSSGTTGLASASADLAVIGDNIANANTIGFKEGRAAFEDALAQTVVNGNGQVGLGSRLQAVQKILTQGALSNTGNATDLALQGGGFFEVRGTASDGRTGAFLTRAGQFSLDRDGYLVNLDGLRVQGFAADATGALTPRLGDLQVGNAAAQPLATANVTLKANLQGDAPILAPFDPAQPSQTSNFSTTITLYDSLGKSYAAPVYFRNAGGGQWEWHAMTDGANVQGGTAGVASGIADGQLTFDSQGRLAAQNQTSNFNPLNAVAPQPLNFDFGDPTGAGGTGLLGLTQFAGASAATFVGQDGYESGQLTSIQIDRKGVDQVERMGGNLFAPTTGSGEALVGAAGDGGRAFISAGTLEQSNVDIADQFVRMIAAQRSFEANSKTISTADQLLSELIAMKR